MPGVPESSRGGGALPDPITTPVSIVTTDVDAIALAVEFPDGMNASPVEISTAAGPPVAVYTDNTTAAVYVGGGSDGSAALSTDASDASLSLAHDDGSRAVTLATGSTQDLAAFVVAGDRPVSVNKDGYLLIRKAAAPANGDLANGEFALWLDGTAAKLMVKGKKTDGTVVTGEVALTP